MMKPDVAHDAGLVPVGDRLAVLADLVLPLAGRLQVVLPQRLHADEHLDAAGARRLLDEPRDARGGRVHLHHEVDGDPFSSSRSAITPSKIASQCGFREKLSSVKK